VTKQKKRIKPGIVKKKKNNQTWNCDEESSEFREHSKGNHDQTSELNNPTTSNLE
jgi:hypothetical protein